MNQKNYFLNKVIKNTKQLITGFFGSVGKNEIIQK
jgi:hypothetical protein